MRFIPWILLLAALLPAPSLHAQDVTYPERIGDREFVLDEAGMIDEGDREIIRSICDTLLTDRQIPIIVVTIDSMRDYGAGDWTIERYAMNLFDEWGIGYEDYNYGILLLISEGDRKARIELGADWGREHDDAAAKIMDRMIIPKFKAGRFSEGIVDGVNGLNLMARGEDIPGSPAGDMARSVGSSIGAAFRWVVANILFVIAFPLILLGRIFGWGGRGGGSGGSFGGGSFGGGFSGGGGATGSW